MSSGTQDKRDIERALPRSGAHTFNIKLRLESFVTQTLRKGGSSAASAVAPEFVCTRLDRAMRHDELPIGRYEVTGKAPRVCNVDRRHEVFQ